MCACVRDCKEDLPSGTHPPIITGIATIASSSQCAPRRHRHLPLLIATTFTKTAQDILNGADPQATLDQAVKDIDANQQSNNNFQ